jgi:hypothetical protein
MARARRPAAGIESRRRGDLRDPLSIGTPTAASIRKLALVRLGAVTHSVNMEQRYVPLSFTAGSGTLTATAPRDANVAPPASTCCSRSTPTACPRWRRWSP